MAEAQVAVVGFGTLLLQESVGDTLATEPKRTYLPVVVKGYKRLFNLRPDHYEASHFLGSNAVEAGAANIAPAEGHHFNGLAFIASVEDLAHLDRRERYYQRSVVPYFHFKSGAELGQCHVYQSPKCARWLNGNKNELLPLWRDIVYARVGAYRISEAFGKMYDETTFLADGKTLMIDHYQAHKKAMSDLASVRK